MDALEKGRKRKEPEIFIEPIPSDSGTEDDTPLAFKRVLRKKGEESKEEARKQPVRKVTIKVPAKKKAPKETPSAPFGTGRRKKMDDTNLAIGIGNVTIIPPKTCAELVDEIIENGMLKNVQLYYEHLDDDEQREVEEAVLLYLDIYKKALLEIEKQISAQLYDNLDGRRLSAIEEDKQIKIQELLTTCGSITLEELDRTLEVADKKIFHSKHRIVSLMLGRVNDTISETHKAWVQFFAENPGFYTSPKAKTDTTDIPVEGKGKGIMGTSSTILKDIKILDIKPPVESNVHDTKVIPANVEILTDSESVQVINVEDNSPSDQNVQVEDTIHKEEPTVTDTAPSGEATSAKEEAMKVDKPSEEKKEESGRELVVSASLLSIDTSQVEQKSLTEMSSTELVMIVAQKMMKEGSVDKGVIDQSIPILHRLVPECKFDKGASPSGKLKTITERISKDFQSLHQISNRQALERFTQAKRATFDQMIESEKKEIIDKLKLIDNALRQCTNIYRVCCNTGLLTTDLDKRIKDTQEKIVGIINSFDGSNSLTTSIDG
ncbi:uncharacterized protein LOC131873613 [Cryptomeria japonica]|uniref:uncharacterized protein LOC131873613 n=1 Tax=Cryptomeria japonica TaxID=3369 RepID=UPI0027DA073D|nr:uncharacterized protein LOC131873613 [Cryptomeria japonica]